MEALIQQVADENGLEVMSQLEAVQPGTSTLRAGERSQGQEEQLSRRYELMQQHLSTSRQLQFKGLYVQCQKMLKVLENH